MVCLICGVAFIILGREADAGVLDAMAAYMSFVVTLAYGYEVWKMSLGAAIVSAIISTGITYLLSLKFASKSFSIASLGLSSGLLFGLFLVSLFDMRSNALVYPVLLLSTLVGAAAYFKGDKFFAMWLC